MSRRSTSHLFELSIVGSVIAVAVLAGKNQPAVEVRINTGSGRNQTATNETEAKPPPTIIQTKNASMQFCDADNPCPGGSACLLSHFVEGVQMCYAGGVNNHSEPRKGRCPLPAEGKRSSLKKEVGKFVHRVTGGRFGSNSSDCGALCNFDSDCLNEKHRCCFNETCGRSCTKFIEIPPDANVTIIDVGDAGSDEASGDKNAMFSATATIALVQSGGLNILWDTGNIGQRIRLIKGLRDRAGLELSDINLVFTSNSNPEHNSNAGLFPDINTSAGTVTARGSVIMPNQFQSDQSFVVDNNTKNVELIQTPGIGLSEPERAMTNTRFFYYSTFGSHSPYDTTMLVNNVAKMGTIALSGDAIQSADDWSYFDEGSFNHSLHRESRRRVFCIANVIVPGHGAPFVATKEMRQRAGGCDGLQEAKEVTGGIVLTIGGGDNRPPIVEARIGGRSQQEVPPHGSHGNGSSHPEGHEANNSQNS